MVNIVHNELLIKMSLKYLMYEKDKINVCLYKDNKNVINLFSIKFYHSSYVCVIYFIWPIIQLLLLRFNLH